MVSSQWDSRVPTAGCNGSNTRSKHSLTMTSKLIDMIAFPGSVPTSAIYELEDALRHENSTPEKVLALMRTRPSLSRALINEDTRWRGEPAVWDFLDMKGVTMEQVQELHQLMKRRFPRRVLHHACKLGCHFDIIVFILEQNRKAALSNDWDDHLPLYNLLGSCNQDHLPALRLLLDLSSSRVKKDVPKFIQRAVSNRQCPQEILDDLTSLAQT